MATAQSDHIGYQFDFDDDDYAPLSSPTDTDQRRNDHLLSLHRTPQRWGSGVCACFDDMRSCCMGLWCPCVLFGRNVEVLEGRPWTGPCIMHVLLWGIAAGIGCSMTHGTFLGLLGSCVPCYACGYRKMLRSKYNLEDAPCGDLVTHLCCHQCALCQEYREIRDRMNADASISLEVPSNQVMERYPTSNGTSLK